MSLDASTSLEDPSLSSGKVAFQTLDLDAPLMLLSLQEAAQHLDQLRVELQRHGHSPYLDLVHSSIVRLTYCLLRCKLPENQFDQVRVLHSLSRQHLASRLYQLPTFRSHAEALVRSLPLR